MSIDIKEIGEHWDVHHPSLGKYKNVYPISNQDTIDKISYSVKLTCKKVMFASCLDEGLFFAWIRQIQSVITFRGLGEELYLFFESSNIDDSDLIELLALFDRYKINMKQLSIFLNTENKEWFADKKTYWHRKVFGAPSEKAKS